MSTLKVIIHDLESFTCSNCHHDNVFPTELVYEDELELLPQTATLIAELGLKQVFSTDNTCISIYKRINTAFRELINNTEAYEIPENIIENVKMFLWAIRLSIEEYPEGKISFVYN